MVTVGSMLLELNRLLFWLIVLGCAGCGAVQAGESKDLSKGCVSISFDDGYEAVYRDALPMFAKRQMPATAYITTGFVGMPGFLTWGQIKQLEKKGWEIGAHSETHPLFETLPLDEAAREAFSSLDQLKRHGLHPCGFAFPFGSYRQDIIARLATRFCELRGFWDRDELNDPNSMNPDLIQVKGVVRETSMREIQAWIDQAKEEKRCLALVFHDLSEKDHYTGSPEHIGEKGKPGADYEFYFDLSSLEKTLQAVKASELPVVTESELAQIPGKPVFRGKGGFLKQTDEGLISRRVPALSSRNYWVQAFFNTLEMKGGSVDLEIEEFDAQNKPLGVILLGKVEEEKALTLRRPYQPAGPQVASFRVLIRPKGFRGRIHVTHPILSQR